MSYAIIRRITVKKDGVYLYFKVNNDSLPFCSRRMEILSDAYKEQGQRGLDIEMIKFALDDGMLSGSHPSVMRYREVLELPRARELLDDCREAVGELYSKITMEDKKSLRERQPTSAGQECWESTEKLRNEVYGKLADEIERRDKRRETEAER